MQGPSDFELTRRDLLKVGAVSVAVSTVPLVAKGQAPAADAPVLSKVSFTVNGKAYNLKLDTRTSLLDALREQLHLSGTKKGCDHGQCGACTVLVDGRRINSCLSLAVMHEGNSITTIEGLGAPGNLHAMQAAFVKHEVGGARAARSRRYRHGRDGHDRHRHRQLHDHRPDRSRDDGCAAR